MTTVEDQAKAQGWNPEYTGANAKTAEEFVAAGENIASIGAERNKKLISDMDELKASNAELKTNINDFISQQHKVTAEADQRGYDRAMKSIDKKQRKAAEEGDVEAYDAAAREKQELKPPAPKANAPAAEPPPPDFVAWHKENSWYKPGSTGDPATIAADTYSVVLSKTRPDLVGPAFYKEVEKHIKLVMPGSFGKPSSNIESGGHRDQGNGGNGGKTYKDLPKEAKDACDMQVKKFGIEKEDYVKNYPWGE